MLRIHCPFCGERPHSEFSYGGDGSVTPPELSASAEQWHDAVYLRENIAGRQLETWHHSHGCRLWLLVERDTLTHEIFSVRCAHPQLQRLAQQSFNPPAPQSPKNSQHTSKKSEDASKKERRS